MGKKGIIQMGSVMEIDDVLRSNRLMTAAHYLPPIPTRNRKLYPVIHMYSSVCTFNPDAN